ncbi:MAG TPA: T9SS type A sorting domain-containing protein [Cytophagaceae bacterium]|jgi:hypothetical protein
MKKTLTLAALSIMTVSAFSQALTTVEKVDNFPSIGKSIIVGLDTEPDASILPGTAGDNKVWDFTKLSSSQEDTLEVALASNSPYKAKFPKATHVLINKSLGSIGNEPFVFNSYSYFTEGQDFITGYGLASPNLFTRSDVDLLYINPPAKQNLKYTYGATIKDTLYNTIVLKRGAFLYEEDYDSLRSDSKIIGTDVVDARGTMKLPGGASYEALRVKSTSLNTDNYIGYIGGQPVKFTDNYTTESYYWVAKNIGTDLVTLDYSDNEVVSATYYKRSFVTKVQPEYLSTVTTVYPIPTSDILNVDLALRTGESAQVVLKDLAGKVLVVPSIKDGMNYQLEVNNLPAGIYLLTVTQGDKSYSKPVMINN